MVTKDAEANLSQNGNELTLTFEDVKRIGTYQIRAVPNGGESRLLQSADIATINIAPAELTLTENINLTRAYNGANTFTLSAADVNSLYTGEIFEEDSASIAGMTGSTADTSANVGMSTLVLDNGGQLVGEHGVNYRFVMADNVSINTEIKPATQDIMVSDFDVKTTATTLTVSNVETSSPLGDFVLEYGVTDDSSGYGTHWQSSPVFTGLKTDTKYYIHVRVAKSQNHSVGAFLAKIINTTKGVTAEDTKLVYTGRTQELADLFEFADGLSIDDYDLRLLDGKGEIEGSILNFEKVGTFEIGAFAKHNDERAEAVLELMISPRSVRFGGEITLTKTFDGSSFFGILPTAAGNFTSTVTNADRFLNAENLESGIIERDELLMSNDFTHFSGEHMAGSNAGMSILEHKQPIIDFLLYGAQAANYELSEKPVINTVITQATRDNQFELNLGVESFSHNHVSLSYTLTHLELAERLMTPMNFTSLTRAEVDDTPRVEYAYSATNSITGVTWQTSPTFTGLQPNTTYHFFARVAETNNFHATAHEVLSLRTNALGNVTVPEEIEDGNGGGVMNRTLPQVLKMLRDLKTYQVQARY
ncbi:hypothetical protein [Lactococcus protaetiae]|uniref:Uncharacterized protein n=1 Tax=Lactococcus protaetiae TaxID=2592653 RepID=A0A514Z8N8_9LACT|nr:hypothetical protein [Lactococcus protaetiae]QDK70952.1 hypothetical protein FLP15_07005 [Lactococcus protaetiae]